MNKIQQYFATVFASWKHSLAMIFVAKNCAVHGSLVLNCWYRCFVRQWGIFLNIILASALCLIIYTKLISNNLYGAIVVMVIFVGSILISMRPSVGIKDSRYFLVTSAYALPLYVLSATLIGGFFSFNVPYYYIVLALPFFSFLMLFWFDGSWGVRNGWNACISALKMYWHTLPLCMFIALNELVMVIMLGAVMKKIPVYGAAFIIAAGILALVLVPLFIAPFVIIYVKQVNERRKLYFC